MIDVTHGCSTAAGGACFQTTWWDHEGGFVATDQQVRPAGRVVRQRVGPTLRAMRARKKLSLNQLADEAGISPSHLSRIERGLTVPSYDVLDNIAAVLGSDLNSLRSEEQSARAVDQELQDILTNLKVSESVQAELLQLGNEARRALADALTDRKG